MGKGEAKACWSLSVATSSSLRLDFACREHPGFDFMA
jgi:hypothetical protein